MQAFCWHFLDENSLLIACSAYHSCACYFVNCLYKETQPKYCFRFDHSSHKTYLSRLFLQTTVLWKVTELQTLFGTHCPKTCGNRSVLQTLRPTDRRWRHFYCRNISVSSALKIFYEKAPHKFIFDINIDIDIADRWFSWGLCARVFRGIVLTLRKTIATSVAIEAVA